MKPVKQPSQARVIIYSALSFLFMLLTSYLVYTAFDKVDTDANWLEILALFVATAAIAETSLYFWSKTYAA